MDDTLRADLLEEMTGWASDADLCIAIGTSLCGMTADCVAESTAERHLAERHVRGGKRSGEEGVERRSGAADESAAATTSASVTLPANLGLVIINLQRTRLDSSSSLRIWGVIDDVLKLLAKEMKIEVPNKICKRDGEQWTSEHPRCRYNTPKRGTTNKAKGTGRTRR